MWAFNKFKDYLIISRQEYILPVGIPIGGITVLLAISSFAEALAKIYFIAAAGSVLLLSNFLGSKVNCLSDYESDKNYKRDGILYKSNFSKAIDSIGRNNVKKIIILEIIITFIIVLMLTVVLSKIILIELWLVGLVLAIAYSTKPLKFKGRGVLNIITLTLILFILPVTFIYYTIRESMEFSHFIVLAGFGVQVCALILENELEDYPEDKNLNVRNPCVLLGIGKTSYVSLVLIILSSIFLLIYIFTSLEFSSIYLPLFFLAYSYVSYKFYEMFKLSMKYQSTESEEVIIKIKKLGSTLPRWLFWIGFPLFIALTVNLYIRV
ncbi:MAG: UbiA family prenyltransferase [Candidatus Methanoperedens sp.]|nr:UbiA family prenyltransferase [Candidatus Methanoperedens sp.]